MVVVKKKEQETRDFFIVSGNTKKSPLRKYLLMKVIKRGPWNVVLRVSKSRKTGNTVIGKEYHGSSRKRRDAGTWD